MVPTVRMPSACFVKKISNRQLDNLKDEMENETSEYNVNPSHLLFNNPVYQGFTSYFPLTIVESCQIEQEAIIILMACAPDSSLQKSS